MSQVGTRTVSDSLHLGPSTVPRDVSDRPDQRRVLSPPLPLSPSTTDVWTLVVVPRVFVQSVRH